MWQNCATTSSTDLFEILIIWFQKSPSYYQLSWLSILMVSWVHRSPLKVSSWANESICWPAASLQILCFMMGPTNPRVSRRTLKKNTPPWPDFCIAEFVFNFGSEDFGMLNDCTERVLVLTLYFIYPLYLLLCHWLHPGAAGGKGSAH